jgi:sulfatase maturation enzyme AslB (radical SAM superfamily)
MSTQNLKIEDIQVLNLETTTHCNIKCPQCSRINEDGELAEYVTLTHVSNNLLENLEIDKMKKLKLVVLEGDTGDTLMHPKIIEIVERFYNHSNQPKIKIITNGALRSTSWWRKFGTKFSKRLRVQFSIDGLEDTHKLYRIGADYKKLIENVKSFIEGGGNATHRCLVFKHNEHQLEEIANKSREIGFRQFQFVQGDPGRFRGQDKWSVTIKGNFSHYIKPSIINDFSKYAWGTDDWDQNTFRYDNLVNDMVCSTLKKGNISVTAYGHTLPCCVYNADLYFDHPLNKKFQTLVDNKDLVDLNKQTLSNILDKGYFGRLEDMLTNKEHPGRCNTRCSHLNLNPSPIYFIQARQDQ